MNKYTIFYALAFLFLLAACDRDNKEIGDSVIEGQPSHSSSTGIEQAKNNHLIENSMSKDVDSNNPDPLDFMYNGIDHYLGEGNYIKQKKDKIIVYDGGSFFYDDDGPDFELIDYIMYTLQPSQTSELETILQKNTWERTDDSIIDGFEDKEYYALLTEDGVKAFCYIFQAKTFIIIKKPVSYNTIAAYWAPIEVHKNIVSFCESLNKE